MIGDLIARIILGTFYLLQALVVGAVRFIVALLGPGLTAALTAIVVALWWFKWI